MKTVKDVIDEVTMCPFVEEILNDRISGDNEKCTDIVLWQKSQLGYKKHQVSEPFSGHIDQAEFMVMGSNPAYDPDEIYAKNPFPTLDDLVNNPQKVQSFFPNRLDVNNYSNSTYLNISKKYAYALTNFQISGDDLKDSKNDDWQNMNIVLSDVVHCKSNKEYGVAKCCSTCVNRYFKDVMDLFVGNNGKYLILCGDKFWKFLHDDKIKNGSGSVLDKLKEREDNGLKIVVTYHQISFIDYSARIKALRYYLANPGRWYDHILDCEHMGEAFKKYNVI